MLANSKEFTRLVNVYTEEIVSAQILRNISIFENKFLNRTKLQNIKAANFAESLNDSVEYIDSANKVYALVLQLSMKIKSVYSSKKRLLELNRFQRQQILELSDEIREAKTAAQKATVLKNALTSEFINLEHEIEQIKEDLDFVEHFISSAKDTKFTAESYYQSVKQINNWCS